MLGDDQTRDVRLPVDQPRLHASLTLGAAAPSNLGDEALRQGRGSCTGQGETDAFVGDDPAARLDAQQWGNRWDVIHDDLIDASQHAARRDDNGEARELVELHNRSPGR